MKTMPIISGNISPLPKEMFTPKDWKNDWRKFVIIPFLPNMPVNARAPTNGGTIRGSVVSSVKILFPGKIYLVMIYATGIPITEVALSVRKAQMRLFWNPRR